MYINLIVGALFIWGLLMLVQSLWRKHKPARNNLRAELRREQRRTKLLAGAEQRLRELEQERLQPVFAAVQDMQEALPEGQHIECELATNGLTIRLQGEGAQVEGLHIRYRAQAVSLGDTGGGLAADQEYYTLSYLGRPDEERLVSFDQDECIHMIARELARLLQ